MKKELTKVQKYVVVIVLILVAAFGIQFAAEQIRKPVTEDTLEKVSGQTEEIVKSKAKVQVAGEVVNPGIYEAELDMRVEEVIQMAGGFTESANVDKVNLVAYVKDGQKIDVPALKETSSTSKSSSAKKSSSSASQKATTKTEKSNKEATPKPEPTPEPTEPAKFSINVNTASAADFAAVAGVSSAVAEAIVTYRDENGPFESTEGLLDVPGVTMKIYKSLEPFFQN